MGDLIRLLPDSVANQIAAGEVIQRPASVVKELLENAVDSGADNITVVIKDAGRTLIQVIDNGCGMSETDARLCWERHATSKIKDANDLFAIKTKGFRGEALASVAAVSDVTLKTRRIEDELGTHIRIKGSKTEWHEPVSCQAGSNFQVKNLFFNVPARRKFLKSDTVELRHIINEFNNVALAHPDIEFSLLHNNSHIFNLGISNLKQRIIQIFGKHLLQSLVPVNTNTSIIRINGFIGKPEFAKKSFGEQYFFVNRRFIRHNYFHRSVLKAYDLILPPETLPSYFIYFESDPQNIDVNIHPTKTEIKFEDEQAIWQILYAAVKETIGKFNLTPSLDFNTGNIIDIPIIKKGAEIPELKSYVDPSFNPFDDNSGGKDFLRHNKENLKNWDILYSDFNNTVSQDESDGKILSGTDSGSNKFMQIRGKFVITPVKSGMLLIHQKRAYERIIYEGLLRDNKNISGASQQVLFPETIELNTEDYVTFTGIAEALLQAGFDIRDAGNNHVIVYGIPSWLEASSIKDLIEEIFESYKNYQVDISLTLFERLARSIAGISSKAYGKLLEQEEMRELTDQLFGCSNPNYSPSGKVIMRILDVYELEKIINKS